MKVFLSFFAIAFSILVLTCSNVDQSDCSIPPIQANPNGDSELALLMRQMFDDGMRMKQQIKNGEKPEVLERFEKIHTAQATEPEKQASKKYKMYAESYQNMLAQLKDASEEDATDLFNGLVESCMSCHRALCPGPMVRIKKLYVRE